MPFAALRHAATPLHYFRHDALLTPAYFFAACFAMLLLYMPLMPIIFAAMLFRFAAPDYALPFSMLLLFAFSSLTPSIRHYFLSPMPRHR